MTSPDTDDDDGTRYDPLAALTMAELDEGSRQLKASLVSAVTGQTQHYEKALALTLWLHERRRDPAAKLSAIMALPFTAVMDRLNTLGPDETVPTVPTPGP